MEKECKKHGLTKFSLIKNGNRNSYYKCKKCMVEAVQRRREKIKQMAVEYKGGKCEKCGYGKYIGALEFHHENGEKEFGIGAKGYTRSWEKVREELDKCKLLCSNCHREEHAGIK